MHPILSLVLGLACAALGGELFVRGAVGLARWARVPAGIVGATVAAFATSSPELSVSINAARAGTPQIALGDALGSNVVNVGLILGLALLFGPIKGGEGSLAPRPAGRPDRPGPHGGPAVRRNPLARSTGPSCSPPSCSGCSSP